MKKIFSCIFSQHLFQNLPTLQYINEEIKNLRNLYFFIVSMIFTGLPKVGENFAEHPLNKTKSHGKPDVKLALIVEKYIGLSHLVNIF